MTSDLEAMNTCMYESGLEWATKLEGAYIPIDVIRVYRADDPAYPLVNKKEFLVARPDSNWVINRFVLYTSGVVITGQVLQTIIDPVSPKQLQEAVLTLLRNNWTPWIHNTDLFNGVGYQPFVVLNMCQSLYILNHGKVVSKKASAIWALTALDEEWKDLIKQAIEWQPGQSPGDVRRTQEFMKYIFKQSHCLIQIEKDMKIK
jgi:hypothetical protein